MLVFVVVLVVVHVVGGRLTLSVVGVVVLLHDDCYYTDHYTFSS